MSKESEFEYIKLKDFPRAFLEKIQLDLEKYSTGLIAFQEATSPMKMRFCGSGTFVRIQDRYFILTAAHVWEGLNHPSTREVGMTLTTFPAHTAEARSELKGHSIGSRDASLPERGPDLALIELSKTRALAIEVRKSFYNLSLSQNKMLDVQFDPTIGLCAVVGALAELSHVTSNTIALESRVYFTGVYQSHSELEYDLVDVGVDDAGSPNIPYSFCGLSGGGLWQIVTTRERESGALSYERSLEGVAFFCLDAAPGFRIVRCHGRKSLYQYVISAVT